MNEDINKTLVPDLIVPETCPRPASSDKPQPDAEEVNAIFGGLRRIIASSGRKPNRDHLAEALIAECIAVEFASRGQILGTLRTLGFKWKHATDILNRGTGLDPMTYKWHPDDTGRYKLLS